MRSVLCIIVELSFDEMATIKPSAQTQVFKDIDSDGNGTLDREELTKAFKCADPSPDREVAQQ